MITQNPIIGRARKKCAGIYARTLWGKNILQSCPPSTKGKQTATQIETNKLFSKISRLGYQVSPSLLNQLFYEAPIGRSRRAEWIHQIAAGRQKQNDQWIFIPEQITRLGSNLTTCQEPYIITPEQKTLTIPVDELSKTDIALTDEKPCMLLLCQETNMLISLLDYETLTNNTITLTNLSPTILGQECIIYTLWKYNAGTQANPFKIYGRYEKSY